MLRRDEVSFKVMDCGREQRGWNRDFEMGEMFAGFEYFSVLGEK